MIYAPSAAAQKLKSAAHTKMVVWYHDNNIRTWWGRPKRQGSHDEYAVELDRHRRYVAKNEGSIRCAIIYDKLTGREEHRFSKGQWT